MVSIKLTKRQQQIVEIVKQEGPISGKEIAEKLSLTRATLRPDFAILTMVGTLEARPNVGYYYKGEHHEPFKDWFKEHLVKEYKGHPIVIKNSASVYDAIVQIFLNDVGTIYAVDENGHLAGVISRKDLLRAAIGNQNLQELPVSVIMTRMPNIITIRAEEPLINAARKMIEHHVDSLPVVQEVEGDETKFEVIGRVTKTTIAKAFVELGGDD